MAMPQRDDPSTPSSFAEASAFAKTSTYAEAMVDESADESEDKWLRRTSRRTRRNALLFGGDRNGRKMIAWGRQYLNGHLWRNSDAARRNMR